MLDMCGSVCGGVCGGVCVTVYGEVVGRGWRCVEMEALRVVGMFGVWWFWVCGGVWKGTEVCGECVIVCRDGVEG